MRMLMPSSAKDWLCLGGLVALYCLSAYLGLSFAVAQGKAATIWLPSGIAFAVLWIAPRYWLAILLATLGVNFYLGHPLWVALPIALGNLAEAYAGRIWLHYGRFRPSLERVRDVLLLIGVALLCPWLSALTAATTLYGAGLVATPQWLELLLSWWGGNVMGVLLVMPLVLTWWFEAQESLSNRIELLVLTGLLIVGAGLVFALPVNRLTLSMAQSWVYSYTLAYALLPLLIWGAIRYRPREVSLLNVVLATVAIVGTVAGLGPFSVAADAHNVLLLYGFLAAIVIATLILAASNSERLESEYRLLASEQRFRDVVNASGEYVWEVDHQLRYTYLSERVECVLGYPVQALYGWQLVDLVHISERERLQEWLVTLARHGQADSIELLTVARDGRLVWQRISALPILDSRGRILGCRGTGQDISERKQSEAHIERLATRDVLTDLPNRVLLYDRLQHALAQARAQQQQLALLFIDLDRFKTINDSLGHELGDELLKAVAVRLSTCLQDGDTLARLGGDEFVILREQVDGVTAVAQLANRLLLAMSQPYTIGAHTLSSGCSIGISLFPDDGETMGLLLRHADTAMYHAKEVGRNNYQFFSPRMNDRMLERLSLEADLRLGLQERQFELWLQPQFDLHQQRLVGAEALLRWRHPTRGWLMPSCFIEIAEESGLIQPLGAWVLEQAIRQLHHWQQRGWKLRLGVNLSARQFNATLVPLVQSLLRETRVDPQYLEFEITESVLLANTDDNIKIIHQLRQLGGRIALDDFGTGYSSLSYLKRFSIQTLKIDTSFVRDVLNSRDDAAIISAIVALARSLGLQTVAEGIESNEQCQCLRELGCDEGQGYWFSPACSAQEFSNRYAKVIDTSAIALVR